MNATKLTSRTGTSARSAAASTQNAPAVMLPLRFIITGLAAFLVGVGLLILKPEVLTTYHYNQHVIAITHLFVLGWVCTVVMGAVYQLVPVALETRLYSERLARWQFLMHAIGFAGMVWMFWKWDMKQVGHFGSLLAVGVAMFVYNVARTLARVPRWNVIATAVASSVVWLSFTVLAGLAIAAAKCAYNEDSSAAAGAAFAPAIDGLKAIAGVVGKFDAIAAMHAHAHLGVVGVFVLLIVGVSYKLVPMFALSDLQSPRRAALSVLLLNVGLAGSFASVLTRSQWKPAFAGILLAGVLVYFIELRAILRARHRRKLDWGLKAFLAGVAMLLPLGCTGLLLSWPTFPLTQFTGQLESAYGFVALLGTVTLAIQGMLYKIVPFIVWYSRYSKEIGLGPVPSLSDLYSERVQIAGFAAYALGLSVTVGGILLSHTTLARTGCVVMALSGMLFTVNLGKMLAHLVRSSKPKVTGSAPAAALSTIKLHTA